MLFSLPRTVVHQHVSVHTDKRDGLTYTDASLQREAALWPEQVHVRPPPPARILTGLSVAPRQCACLIQHFLFDPGSLCYTIIFTAVNGAAVVEITGGLRFIRFALLALRLPVNSLSIRWTKGTLNILFCAIFDLDVSCTGGRPVTS